MRNIAGLTVHVDPVPYLELTSATTAARLIPGTVTFKLAEAKFDPSKYLVTPLNLYCKIKLGHHSEKTLPAIKEGESYKWHQSDPIKLDRKHNEQEAKLKLKDKERSILRENFAEVRISLEDVIARGKVAQWYYLYRKGEVIGEILIEIEHHLKISFATDPIIQQDVI